MVYHLVRDGATLPVCVADGVGHMSEGDYAVPEAEAHTPDGRHFDCPACHASLTGGQAHVPPTDGTLRPGSGADA